jgi:hypothetical protein
MGVYRTDGGSVLHVAGQFDSTSAYFPGGTALTDADGVDDGYVLVMSQPPVQPGTSPVSVPGGTGVEGNSGWWRSRSSCHWRGRRPSRSSCITPPPAAPRPPARTNSVQTAGRVPSPPDGGLGSGTCARGYFGRSNWHVTDEVAKDYSNTKGGVGMANFAWTARRNFSRLRAGSLQPTCVGTGLSVRYLTSLPSGGGGFTRQSGHAACGQQFDGALDRLVLSRCAVRRVRTALTRGRTHRGSQITC